MRLGVSIVSKIGAPLDGAEGIEGKVVFRRDRKVQVVESSIARLIGCKAKDGNEGKARRFI